MQAGIQLRNEFWEVVCQIYASIPTGRCLVTVNISTLCVAKDSTGHSGMCGVPQGATNDLHVMSLSNCELCTNCIKLFNGVDVVLSVGERNCFSLSDDFERIEQSKTLTMCGF